MHLRLALLAACALAAGCHPAPPSQGSTTGGVQGATSQGLGSTSGASSASTSASTSTSTTTGAASSSLASSASTTGGSGASTGTTGGGCACPLTDCGGACVDTRSDPQHCGGCGVVCPSPLCGSPAPCLSGTCQQPGPDLCVSSTAGGAGGGIGGGAGSTTGGVPTCRHGCTDTSDCPVGFTCEVPNPGSEFPDPAVCRPCWPPGVICNGTCIAPNTIQNCGACGRACGAYQDCVDGACLCKPFSGCGLGCACSPGQTRCGDRCVDTASDPEHCGACQAPCGPGQTCQGGACTPPDAGYGPVAFGPAWALSSGAIGTGGEAAVADLDGDGQPDLLQADFQYPGLVVYAYLRRDGGYAPPIPSALDGGTYLVLGAFTDGGSVDLISGYSGHPQVWFSAGDGRGGFGPALAQSLPCSPGTMNLAAGDVTGDGRLDLVASCNPPNDYSDQWVATLPGQGDGTFAAPVFSPVAEPINRIGQPLRLVDLNGDGALDLITGSSVSFNVGGGAFGPPTRLALAPGGEVGAVADLNGDGAPDLVVIDYDSALPTCPLYPLNVFLGRGDGGFDLGESLSVPVWPIALAAGDFDGDGHPDLAVLQSGYQRLGHTATLVQVFYGDGTGHLRPDPTPYPLPEGVQPPLLAQDLDGDGRPELVLWYADRASSPTGLQVLPAR